METKMPGLRNRSASARLRVPSSKNIRSLDRCATFVDEDTTVFVEMAQNNKEEGNRLFQKREYEDALFKYEKAIKLLPKNHIDVANLRSNMASCYMQMKPEDFHQAINECNLALEVCPNYSKALVKRAKCFEALDRLDLASEDVDLVLSLDPNNIAASEIAERVKMEIEEHGVRLDNWEVSPLPETPVERQKLKKKKKKSHKSVEKIVVVEEKHVEVKEEAMKTVKLVFGEDIRYAQVPANCTILQLREIIANRFPKLKAFLIKFKDQDGDLVTITTSEELMSVEESAGSQRSVKLFIIKVRPEDDPLFEEVKKKESSKRSYSGDKSPSVCVDDWIMQFAILFKNHVGCDSDEYLNLHELGTKVYSEAMEETITSEEAQEIFTLAEKKFQEMTALALFNWGNVHMSRAKKRLCSSSEDASKESMLAMMKASYEWAQAEYVKAGNKYEEALKLKPDFYEALLALGFQQFELAKLSWCSAIGNKADVEDEPSTDAVLKLFNLAEENIERGTRMREEMKEQTLEEVPKPDGEKVMLQKMGLEDYFKDQSTHETPEQDLHMKSQINTLWGTVLYERSVVEFKLGIPLWEECLMAAMEKFTVAGASPADIAVMVKKHCANETTQEDLCFKIDEIVQTWNEMYDAKRWLSGVSSFKLEPLLRRRVSKLHNTLEHI
ncbi:protein PHOX1-like [Zingiber officinale]|uniref:protein PHOX1-like n=1 Tax=Zingiber officinale TaxID=94328 RepID=UPI001C4CEFF8|nr:protein PHOX1-like [Zingiber officinale]